jgi:peptidoglycan LD-endopeptidase CwlK
MTRAIKPNPTALTAKPLCSRSLDNLKGVHPDLVEVVIEANKLFFEKHKSVITVIDGVRTPERQRELYGQGRGGPELSAAGIHTKYARPNMRKVTWTLRSNHALQADGFGHAVDLVHIPRFTVKWEDAPLIADCMFGAAQTLRVHIRWGKDWNRNGVAGERAETDSPHWELWGSRYNRMVIGNV